MAASYGSIARMIDHVWTVVCRRSILDESTNNYTLVEVLEQLSMGEPPEEVEFPVTVPFEFHIVSLWTRSDPDEGASGEERRRLFGPGGEELHQHTMTVELEDNRRFRNRGRFSAIPIAGAGYHYWEISFRADPGDEWTQVATSPLEVRVGVEGDE